MSHRPGEESRFGDNAGGVGLVPGVWHLRCDTGKSVLGLHKSYWWMFRGGIEGGEKEGLRWFVAASPLLGCSQKLSS